MLPLSVLIPTRNAMALLPGHVQMMRQWLDLAEEIIVVDSSWDDSLAYLQRELAGFNVRFERRPAGLYQAWNHGIGLMRSRYVYISTIGDSIHRAGLEHLVGEAERLACDVVVSPPDLLTESGQPKEDGQWLVHRIISFLKPGETVCLEGIPLFMTMLSFLPDAILGSSASNIYRTATLQKNPFPLDFGTAGDGAWGAMNALSIRLGISPLRTSSFMYHPKTYPLSEYEVNDLISRMFECALVSLDRAAEASPEIRALAENMGLARGIRSRIDFDHWRDRLRQSRESSIPWYVKPGVWNLRANRDAAGKSCLVLLEGASQLNGHGKLVEYCLGHFMARMNHVPPPALLRPAEQQRDAPSAAPQPSGFVPHQSFE